MQSESGDAPGLAMTNMRLRSSAFSDGEAIPERFTDDGENVSPPLEWSDVPAGTRSLALFCHDPDAPVVNGPIYGFTHWVLYNVSPDEAGLPESVSDWTFGRNDYGKRSYDGPRPPREHGTHRYYFWLLALEKNCDLEAGLPLRDMLSRVQSDVLGMSRIVGLYERSS